MSTTMRRPYIQGMLNLHSQLIFRQDKDGGDSVIYYGLAEPGTDESAEKWLITKFFYDADGLTGSGFPAESADFNAAWTNRAGYTYS